MRKLVILTSFLLLAVMAFGQIKPWREGEMEVRVSLHSPADALQLSALRINCDISLNTALAYVVPSELEAIKAAGLSYTIVKPNLNAWSASFGTALVPPGYYTFSQIKNIADSLATNFPSICKKVVFGYNTSMQELAALKISDNADADEPEPEILFDGGIHGDEVGGSQNVIQFARDLCLGYGVDPDITGLVDTREIWLYYCVNPWGRDFMTRYNSASIDINRDNGYMWGDEGGSPGPFSQPETKALRKCQYENQFVVYTNYHSGTEIISYPWSYRLSPCPDKPSIDYLAQVYSIASGYPMLSYGQGSIYMYLINGSTKDFNYGALGSVAWSIEISMEKQPTNPQYYYSINKPAMLELIRYAGYGLQGTVTDAVSGAPVKAAIFTGSNYPAYSDGEAGDYHKYLKAGTYPVKIIANGYWPVSFDNVTVSDQQATTLDVQLTPFASQYAYRVITCNIPAFNAQNPGDEGYTAACLGAPDHVSYSLGRGGYIIVDMQDTIFDSESGTFDVTVYEGDSSPEGYTLYAGATMDGPWVNLGTATGTASFNLEPFGVDQARYFMLLDDNNGQSNVNDAGFEFDAMACLHPARPDTVGHLSGYVYDVFSGLPLPGAVIYGPDSLTVSDTAGYYSTDVLRGNRIICAGKTDYRTECDTLAVQPAMPYTNDFYLFSTVGQPDFEEVSDIDAIYPDPFRDHFTVRFLQRNDGPCYWTIYDLSGKKLSGRVEKYLEKGIYTRMSIEIFPHITSIKPGCYIIELATPDRTFRQMVIKAL